LIKWGIWTPLEVMKRSKKKRSQKSSVAAAGAKNGNPFEAPANALLGSLNLFGTLLFDKPQAPLSVSGQYSDEDGPFNNITAT
jgi:hypothetical protein